MPDPVAPEPAAPKHGADKRLADLPRDFDVGEQIVGSEEWFRIAVPKLIDGSAAIGIGTASVTEIESHSTPGTFAPRIPAPDAIDDGKRSSAPDSDPQSAFSVLHRPIRVGVSSAPLEVQFAPKRVGNHVATLAFHIQWADGILFQHDVSLRGRARERSDRPHDWQEASPPASSQTTTQASDAPAPDPLVRTSSMTSLFKTATAASALALAQRRGLEDVARHEIESYKRQPPKAPWWALVAEVAIQLASTGLASAFGKLVMPNVVKWFTQSMALTPKVTEAVVAVTSDVVKDGLKNVGKFVGGVVAKPPKPSQSPAPAESVGNDAEEQSTDPAIAFFDYQSQMLDTVAAENASLVTNYVSALAPVEMDHPGITAPALRGLEAGFVGLAKPAEHEQVVATEREWVAGVARARLRNVALPDGTVVTDGYDPNGHADGVLEIDVTTTVPHDHHADLPTGSTQVTAAKIFGIAKPVADQLTRDSLLHARIPLVLNVKGPNYHTRIRRNEAGQLEIWPSATSWRKDEAPMGERVARDIVGAALSKPLRGWGIGIDTDDTPKSERT